MSAQVTEDELIVNLEDGSALHVPLEGFPLLLKASPAERANFRLLGNGIGIHWPDLDEDISVEGLLSGRSTPTAYEYPAVCDTCGEPYSKTPTFRALVCSNGFHCCRDCLWRDGRRLRLCDQHATEENDRERT